MKITKHLINILCLSFLLYAPFSYSAIDAQPLYLKASYYINGAGQTSGHTCGDGQYHPPAGVPSSATLGSTFPSQCRGSTVVSAKPIVNNSTRELSYGSPTYTCQDVPNSTLNGSSCSCKSEYQEETLNGSTSCQLKPCQSGYQRVPPSTTCTPIPPPECEAPYVYDPATNSCQLTACPVGFERVPPSTSCTPIKCEPPSVMGENGVCVIPPCPIGFERINGVCTRSCENLGGEPTESSMCNYWHKYIDQCRYEAKEIEVKCTNQALHNPNGGLTDIPLCKRYGKFYEGVIDKTPWSARPVFGCSKTPPDTVTTITLPPPPVAGGNPSTGGTTAPPTDGGGGTGGTGGGDTSTPPPYDYESPNDTPFTPAPPPTGGGGGTGGTGDGSGTGGDGDGSGTGGTGDGSGTGGSIGTSTCGSFACEETLKAVGRELIETNATLKGEGVDSTFLSRLFNASDNAYESSFNSVKNGFAELDTENVIHDALSSILPASPFEKVFATTNASCQMTFTLVGVTYTLSICEALPYLHPAINFILAFLLSLYIINLVLERPRN